MFWLAALKHLTREAELPPSPQPSSGPQEITPPLSRGDFRKRCVHFRRVSLFFWGGERGGWTEHYSPYSRYFPRVMLCYRKQTLDFFFFNFVFYLQAKAKLFHIDMSRSQDKSQRSWAVATFSQATHEQRQQMKVVCSTMWSSRP